MVVYLLLAQEHELDPVTLHNQAVVSIAQGGWVGIGCGRHSGASLPLTTELRQPAGDATAALRHCSRVS